MPSISPTGGAARWRYRWLNDDEKATLQIATGGGDGVSFRLAIISDEISDDPERALDLAQEWGLTLVELRTLGGRHVVDLTPAEVAPVRRALARRGLAVECIAAPLYKTDLPAPGSLGAAEEIDRQLAMLAAALRVAGELGARLVRAFSFWRRPFTPRERAQVAAHLRRAAELAAAHGCLLALENEHSCVAATGAEAAALLAAVGSPYLKAIWDPGNAHVAGETAYPHGYASLRGHIVNVHVKDAVRAAADGEPWRLLGEGEVDWRGHLAALVADGYDGPLTLEPHPIRGYRREDSARLCLESLRRLLAAGGA